MPQEMNQLGSNSQQASITDMLLIKHETAVVIEVADFTFP